LTKSSASYPLSAPRVIRGCVQYERLWIDQRSPINRSQRACPTLHGRHLIVIRIGIDWPYAVSRPWRSLSFQSRSAFHGKAQHFKASYTCCRR
jgi:hypothetical protein